MIKKRISIVVETGCAPSPSTGARPCLARTAGDVCRTEFDVCRTESYRGAVIARYEAVIHTATAVIARYEAIAHKTLFPRCIGDCFVLLS
jgi:hypothetical protein